MKRLKKRLFQAIFRPFLLLSGCFWAYEQAYTPAKSDSEARFIALSQELAPAFLLSALAHAAASRASFASIFLA